VLFKHQPRAPVIDPTGRVEQVDEEQRVRSWQCDRLEELGYERSAAEMIVIEAWERGEGSDLVHRVTDLIGRGATHTQAARIA
jgi:hypothetical protein